LFQDSDQVLTKIVQLLPVCIGFDDDLAPSVC
jgi:hypothetical protein